LSIEIPPGPDDAPILFFDVILAPHAGTEQLWLQLAYATQVEGKFLPLSRILHAEIDEHVISCLLTKNSHNRLGGTS
jgi:hypothetical protein